jgi:hypothetical protein
MIDVVAAGSYNSKRLTSAEAANNGSLMTRLRATDPSRHDGLVRANAAKSVKATYPWFIFVANCRRMLRQWACLGVWKMPDRIFVSVAVSRPEQLAKLPGALTAGRRMAKWAADNNYHVVAIDDSTNPVTKALLRKKLLAAIDEVQREALLRRFVLFFAGHGAIKGVNEPYWLLSNWWTETEEAIDLVTFQRMLRYYGPRQVALIGDACQVVHRDFLEVNGSSILPRRNEQPSKFELDQFFAADAGEQAFMIKAEGSNEAYCIFTEVLLNALEGDAKEAFDPSSIGELVVTSGSLTSYIEAQVPLEAGRHHLTMSPLPQPGFYTDTTYVRFPGSWLADRETNPDAGRTTPRATFTETPKTESIIIENDRLEKLRSDKMQKAANIEVELAGLEVPPPSLDFGTETRLIVAGALARSITAPKGSTQADDAHLGWYRVDVGGTYPGRDWADLLVELDTGQNVYVCAVSNFTAALQVHKSGDINLLHRSMFLLSDEDFVRNVLARLSAGLLNATDIIDIAAQARRGKHIDFTLGCLAAYLYASIGDLDGIRSTAYFYTEVYQIVPLDIALLSGGLIRQNYEGQMEVDIPATTERKARTDVERAHGFTHMATPAVEGAKVGGRAPWLRGGWRAIDTANIDDSALAWREEALGIMRYLERGEFSTVNEQGVEALLELVGRARAVELLVLGA